MTWPETRGFGSRARYREHGYFMMLEKMSQVFVLDDGGETDLDLGNYERFMGVNLRNESNLTTG